MKNYLSLITSQLGINKRRAEVVQDIIEAFDLQNSDLTEEQIIDRAFEIYTTDPDWS